MDLEVDVYVDLDVKFDVEIYLDVEADVVVDLGSTSTLIRISSSTWTSTSN